MKIEQAGMLLDALVAAFPRVNMGAETAQIYARFLADLEYEVAATAVATHIAEGRFFPSIAELRALARRDDLPDPDQAFAAVLREVSRVGSYGSPRFAHGAIAEAVDAIGWRELCLSDNAPALRAHFAAAYETAARRSRSNEHRELVRAIVGELPRRALEGAQRSQPQLRSPK